MQRRRLFFQLGFFALFLLAPALNLLRFDLTETQLWVLGQRWSLGIDAFRAGQISATALAAGVFWRAILPALALVAGFLAVAWRYGRLYCGWLCPHFSLVELLNATLQRPAAGSACGSARPPRPARPTAAGGRCSVCCAWASASCGRSRC
jgi:polyferredoxin